jgi:hypothetical protein
MLSHRVTTFGTDSTCILLPVFWLLHLVETSKDSDTFLRSTRAVLAGFNSTARKMASSDHEDEDLKRAIALSLAESNESGAAAAPQTSTTMESAAKPGGGIPGLDRQAMERERLARQAARKRDRSVSPPPIRGSRKAPKLEGVETTTIDMPSGARLNFFTAIVQEDQAGRKSEAANAANAKLKNASSVNNVSVPNAPLPGSVGLAYPHGVVKKTWAFNQPRTGNDVKLEEVLEPNTLRTAVLSAFQWDPEWVLAKLKVPTNGGTTKCVFIMQAKDEAMRTQMTKETQGMRSFLRLCFPPMDGQIHCMHSKLMLLFHPQKLRVAVPTANLLNFDWGETGVMENSCFMIDLPRLPEGVKVDRDELTDFGKELMFFLDKQGLDDDVKGGVLNFDFVATKDMAFIHTVGGALYRSEAGHTGYPGLGRAVRQMGLRTDDLEIEFAASSIGSLNDEYLRCLHSAARGEDAIMAAAAASAEAKADFFKSGPKKAQNPQVKIREKMRIYFPTHDTVKSSTAGAAGTICMNRKWWENMPFPRDAFRDCVSRRSGLLSHNKIMYARGKRKASENRGGDEDVAWAYVGSANMSESAWGKLVQDKKEKAWKINCRNWECGVLLKVPREKLESAGRDDVGGKDLVSMDVFEELVPRPFEYPSEGFGDKEPWYFQEQVN